MVAITLLAFSSCVNSGPNQNFNLQKIIPDDISIITIDSCEYILSGVYAGNSICHKGNCKYCLERNK